SDYAIDDVGAALAAARSLGGQPVLFTAVAPAHLPPWLRVDARAHDRRRLSAAQNALRTLAARFNNPESRAATGAPSRAIATAARSAAARLIVITLKRSPGLLGPRRGSVTYQVLCDNVAPVLALPER